MTAGLESSEVDRKGLAERLEATSGAEVRFDDASRLMYSTDASNYRQIPIGVVLPRNADDIMATVDACRAFDAPVLPRGGGTSLAGQTCNVAVVIDMSKYMNRVLHIEPERRLARVQPGVVLDDLRVAAEKHGLTFGPDPATHNRCTLGGMIGNNSCGIHSVMSGKTDENVVSLDVLTYRGQRLSADSITEDRLDGATGAGTSGEIPRKLRDLRNTFQNEIRSGFSDIPRRVSGFDLPHLLPERGFNVAAALVGTEGTCVTVLEAELRLVKSPPSRTLMVLAYEDIFTAAEQVPNILEFGPIGLEGMDHRLLADLRLRDLYRDEVRRLPEPPAGPGGWLLVEFGGDSPSESEDRAGTLVRHLERSVDRPGIRLCRTNEEARRLWEVREAGLGASALVPGKLMRWPGWDDSAVAPNLMAPYMRDLQRLMDQHGLDGAFYGHFGDGCLHVRYNFDLETTKGIARYRGFLDNAADLVISYGGSLSGEHGDGQSHGELLERMYSPALMDAFRQFKAIWDPDGRMNPGKVIDARPITADIKLEGYRHSPIETVFRYPNDNGRFSMAALRCVGVGKCRRHDGGVMCPSYMATREEMHSTRGRARLLFEMVNGGSGSGGWRDKGVREALDLCLACKACKSECPVGVDMAMYKAEFLSHYYRRKIRPRAAYAMGLVWWWARLASRFPAAANLVGSLPVTSALMKSLAGISPRRRLPTFAQRTFKRQFNTHPPDQGETGSRPRVILWADTFNNHFNPEICQAARSVLDRCGFRVVVPAATVCCGRPLYDFGMLGLARQQLRSVLNALDEEIRVGTPVVVLEPSCASVFRDEAVNLFPEDERAVRLSRQTFLLAEFLERFRPDFAWPALNGDGLVQAHCHQKSILGVVAEKTLLAKLGMEVDVLDAGCCGMAGAFGFEAAHFDISVLIGESRLAPAVRAAAHKTVVIADGFSCREQVRQLTGRQPIHLAQLLASALGIQATDVTD